MSREPDRIDQLSEAISTSQEIDWQAEEHAAGPSDAARVVRELAFIARMSEANRRLETGSDDLPFATWGHLRLVARIGVGSYGEVFRAWDETLQREVALKLYDPTSQTDALRRNVLLEESRNLAKIRHENVVCVLGADLQHDRVGFWMELLSGESLEFILKSRGNLDAREASEIGIKICRGLAAVHAAGVIHRDIKPANVFREIGGRICLLDLGAGTTAQDSADRIGTPPYMPPETLIHGESSNRSDIYSVGALLFHMVTQRFPVEAATADELAAKHAHNQRLTLAEARRDLPVEFRRIVQRCLEAEPAKRFASAGELEEALTRFLGLRATRKKRWLAVMLVGVLGSVLAWPAMIKLFRGEQRPASTGLPAGDQNVIAVIGFQPPAIDTAGTPSLAGILDLVDVAVLEAAHCRVVSSEYLLDIRRRRFGASDEPISPDEALTVARDAGATVLLSGTAGVADGTPFVVWRLVDTHTGQTLGGQREQAASLMGVVDRVVDGVLPILAECARPNTTEHEASVADITTSSPRAYNHYVTGLRAINIGNGDQAKHEFESAIALDSTFALAWYQLGLTHSYGYQQELRREMVDHAWAHRSHLGVKDCMRVEANREILYGRFPRSMKVYQEMLVRWPDDREVLRTVAQHYYSKWFGREALSVCEQGLKLYPDDGDLGSLRSECLAACDRPSEAIVEFRKAALKDPKDFYSWLNLGRCLVSLGRPDSAEAAYRNALTIDPASFSAHEGLARCAYVRGNLDQVFAILEPAVHRTSVSVQERVDALIGFPNYGLLYGYFHAARYRECLQTVDRALALVPTAGTQSQRRFQNWRASLLSMMGRGDEALASCTAFSTKADLDSIDRWELEAQRTFALTQLGKLGEARASLAILRRAEPFAFGAYVIRTNLMEAEIELADGRIDECAIRLRDAEKHGIPLFSDLWMRHEWLRCRMLSRAGRLDQAANAYRDMLASNGGAGLLHYELAQVEERRGRKQAASNEYAICLRLWAHADRGVPEVEDAQRRLRRLTSG